MNKSQRPLRRRLTSGGSFESSRDITAGGRRKQAYKSTQDAFSGASIFGINPNVALAVDSVFKVSNLETQIATAHVKGGESIIVISAHIKAQDLDVEEVSTITGSITRRIKQYGYQNVTVSAVIMRTLKIVRFFIRQKNVPL